MSDSEKDKPKSILNKRSVEKKIEKEAGVQSEKLQPSKVKIFNEATAANNNPYSILMQNYSENLPSNEDVKFKVDVAKMSSNKVKLPTVETIKASDTPMPKKEVKLVKEEPKMVEQPKKSSEIDYKNLPPVEPVQVQTPQVSEVEMLNALSKYAEPPKQAETPKENLEIPENAKELLKKEEKPKEDGIETLNKIEEETEKINKQIKATQEVSKGGGLEDLLADFGPDASDKDLGMG